MRRWLLLLLVACSEKPHSQVSSEVATSKGPARIRVDYVPRRSGGHGSTGPFLRIQLVTDRVHTLETLHPSAPDFEALRKATPVLRGSGHALAFTLDGAKWRYVGLDTDPPLYWRDVDPNALPSTLDVVRAVLASPAAGDDALRAAFDASRNHPELAEAWVECLMRDREMIDAVLYPPIDWLQPIARDSEPLQRRLMAGPHRSRAARILARCPAAQKRLEEWVREERDHPTDKDRFVLAALAWSLACCTTERRAGARDTLVELTKLPPDNLSLRASRIYAVRALAVVDRAYLESIATEGTIDPWPIAFTVWNEGHKHPMVRADLGVWARSALR